MKGYVFDLPFEAYFFNIPKQYFNSGTTLTDFCDLGLKI